MLSNSDSEESSVMTRVKAPTSIQAKGVIIDVFKPHKDSTEVITSPTNSNSNSSEQTIIDNTESNKNKRRKRKRSIVWNYFTVVDNNSAVCRCGTKYKWCEANGTSTLKIHVAKCADCADSGLSEDAVTSFQTVSNSENSQRLNQNEYSHNGSISSSSNNGGNINNNRNGFKTEINNVIQSNTSSSSSSSSKSKRKKNHYNDASMIIAPADNNSSSSSSSLPTNPNTTHLIYTAASREVIASLGTFKLTIELFQQSSNNTSTTTINATATNNTNTSATSNTNTTVIGDHSLSPSSRELIMIIRKQHILRELKTIDQVRRFLEHIYGTFCSFECKEGEISIAADELLYADNEYTCICQLKNDNTINNSDDSNHNNCSSSSSSSGNVIIAQQQQQDVSMRDQSSSSSSSSYILPTDDGSMNNSISSFI